MRWCATRSDNPQGDRRETPVIEENRICRPRVALLRTAAALVGLVALLGAGILSGARAAAPVPPEVVAVPGAATQAGGAAAPLAPCPERPGIAPSPLAPALLGIIRERVLKHVGGNVVSVCRMPFGLYEVVIDDDVRGEFVALG